MAKYEDLGLNDIELNKRSIIRGDESRPCWICGTWTKYIDYCTEQRVCSEECMKLQNQRLNDAQKVYLPITANTCLQEVFRKLQLIEMVTECEAVTTFKETKLSSRMSLEQCLNELQTYTVPQQGVKGFGAAADDVKSNLKTINFDKDIMTATEPVIRRLIEQSEELIDDNNVLIDMPEYIKQCVLQTRYAGKQVECAFAILELMQDKENLEYSDVIDIIRKYMTGSDFEGAVCDVMDRFSKYSNFSDWFSRERYASYGFEE